MLEPGQILHQRYQLSKKLGHNAGRQTWLAIDQMSDPPTMVTVKLLVFNPQMQWEDFKLFEREAQVLKQLNHQRIPHYRDDFAINKEAGGGMSWFAIVQDYIPGQSLQQLLDQGERFSERQLKYWAIELLEILKYLHQLSMPVLHRDIKPSNVILGEDHNLYLIDDIVRQLKH